MADGVKTYKIVINGVNESINAVDSLNKQLDALDKRINALEKKNINVGKASSTGGVSYKELSTQEEIEKQILATEQKLAQVRDENYKKLLHMKEELKEYTQIAKSAVAAEANEQGLFDTNTMFGMKAKLKSIKAEMQTVEIGGDRFKELTQQANELNNKLKEIEQSYGQFGRNVGNYADGVAKGMQSVKLTVNGVDREFKSASGAVRTLKNELRTMAVEGQRGTKEYKELQKTVAQLSSTVKDATVSSQAMNNVLHTMQSFVGVGQIGQGLGGLFGFDDSEMQRSIQKLVSLQNVMMGIERINQQINQGVGVGKWIGGINTGVDKAVAGLLKFNTALLGTSKAAQVASVGIKAFGTAIKVAISGGLLLAIDAAINAFSKLVDRIKNGTKEMQAVRQATEAGTEAYVKAKIEMDNLISRINAFNGTKEQEKKLVDELNSKYSDSIGQYKSLAEWKDALIKKAPAYLEMMKKEAEMQAWINKYVETQIKLKDIQWKQQNTILGKFAKLVSDITGYHPTTDALKKQAEQAEKESKKLQSELNKIMSGNQIGVYAPQIVKNGKKTEKAVKDVTHDIYKAEIDAMRDGLNKTLMQLEEEKRQTINKLKQNGQATTENVKRVEDAFYKRRIDTIKEYLQKLTDAVEESAKEIKNIKFEIDTKELEQDIKNLTLKNWSLGKELPMNSRLFMSYEDNGDLRKSFIERLDEYKAYNEVYVKEIQNNYKKIKAIRDNQIKLEKEQEDTKAKEEYESRLESLRKSLEAAEYEADEFKKRNDILKKDNKETYENLLKIANDLRQQIYDVEVNYSLRTVQIEKEMQQKLQDNWIETDENISAQQNKYYDSQMSNFRDFLSKMNNEVQKQPIRDKLGFGIVDVKKTKKNYNEIIEAAGYMEIELIAMSGNVRKAFKDGIIDAETYNAIRKQLIDLQNELSITTTTVQSNLTKLAGDFISSINQYIQYSMQQVNDLMRSIWEYQDAEYDHQMEELEKQIDKYEELLQKQEDITREHADKINDIEDELSTARGDRRQHLIDQLNEEMRAQRASLAEQKRIEKEEERLKKKKEKEEMAQRKREHQRQVTQAFINWHLSIVNALATQPFMPAGLAMGALATALGAVQYALVKSQKYADGGVLQGRSHSQGGIKVLGGTAEVEGGEYIINRTTTTKNIDLLNFVNSKKKRVDLDDLVEFYSGKKMKTTFRSLSPTNKFAEGGQIPVLRSDIDINNRILDAIDNYAERPVVVSVVDINNKQESLKNVKVLAGLSE